MFKLTLIGLVVPLFLATSGVAAPLEDDANAAYDRGDYATALRLWKQRPEAAAPLTQTPVETVATENLALSGNSRWVAIASYQDLDEAIAVAQRYAQQKSRIVRAANGWFAVVLGPFATTRLASFRRIYSGPRLPPHPLLTRGTGYTATVWPLPADASGPGLVDPVMTGDVTRAPEDDASAAYNRGDYATALSLWRQRAQGGQPAAQNSVGLLYVRGRGVLQDYVLAHMWFNLSAAQGDEDAAQNRDAVAKMMTPDQVAEAQRLAREWKPTAGR